MDERLKYIAENMDKLKIGLDDSFTFGCNACGKCCINREDILLTPKDLFKLCRELNKDVGEILQTYCETYVGQDSKIPIVRLLPRGTVKRCPFLKDRKCSVHNAKPVVCAMYPIGRCITLEPKTYGETDLTKAEITFIKNEVDCGIGETHTVREWLTSFGIPVRDEFFLKWHDTIAKVSRHMRNMLKVVPKPLMEQVFTVVFLRLYVEYDLEQDFFPQFCRNADELIAGLDGLAKAGVEDE